MFDDDEDGLPSLGGSGANGGLSLSETDLDETLRSIEAGKFDIDEFLQAEGEEGLGLDDIDGLDIDLEVATSSMAGRGSGGLGRGGRTGLGGRGGRGKAGDEAGKKGAIKGRAVGARDDEEEDEDVMEEDILEDEDLALALGGLIEREDDPMMDVVGLDEDDEEEEDEEEEEEDDEEEVGARRRVKTAARYSQYCFIVDSFT